VPVVGTWQVGRFIAILPQVRLAQLTISDEESNSIRSPIPMSR
jgi:hypothetical protein